MLFYLLRHGEPIYNPDSITKHGHKQAEMLAERLKVNGLDRIYTSTSNRAKQTAEPTCRLLGKSYIELEWCNENLAWQDLTAPLKNGSRHWLFHDPENIVRINDPEIFALGEKWYEAKGFEGCNYKQGIARIRNNADEFFASLGYVHDREKKYYVVTKPPCERVALFAHQGFGLAFLSCVLDIPYPVFCTRFDMEYSGMTVISFDDIGGISIPKVLQLSNDSHLYKGGLSLRYNKRYDV